MTPPLERLAWIGVAALATARLTRFFTSDKLGEWLIVGRVKRWAAQIESPVTPPALGEVDPYPTPEPHWGWRSKLVSGLDCAACIGFWLGALVLLAEALTTRTPLRILRPLWKFIASAFALNYVVFHVSSRIDG